MSDWNYIYDVTCKTEVAIHNENVYTHRWVRNNKRKYVTTDQLVRNGIGAKQVVSQFPGITVPLGHEDLGHDPRGHKDRGHDPRGHGDPGHGPRGHEDREHDRNVPGLNFY